MGVTWAGGASNNAIAAMNNPAAAAQAWAKAKRQNQLAGANGRPLPTKQQMYGVPEHGQWDMGGGGEHGHGGGPGWQNQVRIGNEPGTMSAPSPTSPFAGNGLTDYYKMQQPGQGEWNGLQDVAQVNHWQATQQDPWAAGIRQKYPWAFPASAQQNNQQAALDTGTQVGKTIAGAISGIPGMADGGRSQAKTYLVGEEGPEGYCPDSGGMHIVGAQGPEVRTFPEKGEIIPHKKMMRFMGYPQPRAGGGRVQPMMQMPGDGGVEQLPHHHPRYKPDYREGTGKHGHGTQDPIPRYSGGPVQGDPRMMMGGHQGGGQLPPGISQFALPFIQQYMQPQQPQGYPNTPEAMTYASDPNAPDSPWALARYVRMGLQQAARRRSALEDAKAAVQQNIAQQQEVAGMGYTPNPFTTGVPFTSKYGSAGVTQGRPGAPIHGTFNGMPFGHIGGPNEMQPTGDNPNQETWQQSELMKRLESSNPKPKRTNPVSMLIGPPK